MVNDELWQHATAGETVAYLCVGCLEARIGRRLCPDDFPTVPINRPDHPWDTPRLRDRKRDLL